MSEFRKPFLQLISLLIGLLSLVVGLLVGLGVLIVWPYMSSHLPTLSTLNTLQETSDLAYQSKNALLDPESVWQAPDWSLVDQEPNADAIRYGKDLIANTALYLGPNGKVKQISNGLNCQNCHLQAGTLPLGNNYSAVASTYPKIRGRSGTSEDVVMRINGCFERSLNGTALDPESKEMKAMVAYMTWLGKEVPTGIKPLGAGLHEVPFLDRAADPIHGKTVYEQFCQSCHRADGQGIAKQDGSGYLYPPLWGEHSYNQRAGLYRMSRFAGYVKANMPFGTTFENPVLSDEEAWDVAAYVNSLPRPDRDFPNDWPDISKKPLDHPFGPYSDDFSENQHKFGPYQAIQKAKSEVK
ncbi:c-type cytochrome [Algoriphagus vanfongensis]|uniref:c-type cytochrome n=1 Tax=Algoriphagus vanfongensis TaxID=426371 RepID=UPI00040F920D|nr:c-type cytochrome [Algoriphagus vanfongensis]